MKNIRLLISIVILIGLSGNSYRAFGEDSSGSDSTLNERIQLLDQKVQELEKKVDSGNVSNGTYGNAPVQGGAASQAFILKSPDGESVLKLRGILQIDGIFFDQTKQLTPPSAANGEFTFSPSTFDPRKVRLYFEGTMAKYYDFRIMPDFGNGTTVLQDAWLDIHYFDNARLEAGKFKSPVGLERLQDEANLIFWDRALPTNLLPNRDVGVFLHGDPFNGKLSYQVGVVNGVVDNALLDTDSNNDKDGVARLFVSPFKGLDTEYLKGLGIGIAGTYGNQNKGTAAVTDLPVYKTVGQTTFFSYAANVVANGTHSRYSPQANYYAGGFGFLAEYSESDQDVTNLTNPVHSNSLRHTAWQTAFSYILTGEKASYYGVTPLHAFDPRKGYWGAIELAARYSRLDIDPASFTTFASRTTNAAGAKEWGGGVNWYMSQYAKVALDYFDTQFDTAIGGLSHPDERAILTRLQLAF